MLSTAYLFLLSIVQGITEFLPVSSSAHLILLPHIMNVEDQGVMLDVAVHVGSLIAVMIYFWRDIFSILRAFTLDIGKKTNQAQQNRRLGGAIIIASLPIMIVGAVIYAAYSDFMRSPLIIACMTILFALVLYYADQKKKADKSLSDMSFKMALCIGIAQILALIPGVSRSGITITAGLLFGLKRTDAARFALLLGIPAILGAGGLAGVSLWRAGDVQLGQDALIAAGFSCVAAYISILIMMRFLKKSTFTPFVVYRLLLGFVLLSYLMI